MSNTDQVLIKMGYFTNALRQMMQDYLVNNYVVTDDDGNLPVETMEFLAMYGEKIVVMQKQLLDMVDIGKTDYPDDPIYDENIIDHVTPTPDGWLIRLWQGNNFFVERENNYSAIVPAPGMIARFYPASDLDIQPYGLFIDGRKIFYDPVTPTNIVFHPDQVFT